jgi:outer membrane receptor protein involved in Fe transport
MKLYNILTLLFVFLFISSAQLLGQGGKIAGKITDAATNDPLPGVNVVVMDLATGAATDLEGDYFILNIPPGVYNVRASLIGYKSVLQTKVEVSSNHTTDLNFQLEETVLEIGEDVVITAERPLIEKDATSTRHYVSAEEISTRPATQLTQILHTLPGIDNIQGELTVRRSSLDQVAFLIDGMRASNPLNYDPYTNINLSSIQELEIITGGFNAEYGQAQSGVFNIVTKDGTQRFSSYSEFRFTPPRVPHWGTAMYDYSTDRYWENTHARHLQWWIDNPDQWIDPTGTPGNDPNSIWSPQQAYQHYIETHSPLTNYTNESSYMGEASIGGPLPVNNLFFFLTAKHRSQPPVTGNTFRARGTWNDATAKLTYRLSNSLRFIFSGFFGEANSIQGMEYMNTSFISTYGIDNKYVYYDFAGYPQNQTDGQTIQMTQVLSPNTFYTLQFSRVFRLSSQSTFPGDEQGWLEGVPQYNYLRAVDEFGNPAPGGYNNLVGLHSSGYYYRGEDKNSDFTLSGDYTSQVNKNWQVKSGGDFNYYVLDRYQESKAYNAIERSRYHPYEGNLYAQNKLEFEGLIMNIGLRYDFYNPNDKKYVDPFDPFDVYTAALEGREPNPRTEPTSTYSQLSPRVGVSHPISENTVLHFSYGHFFQRAHFGNYGEGINETPGLLNTYIAGDVPFVLGNRDLIPRKTVAYEVGIEHNLAGILTGVTAFYKDNTYNVKQIRVITRAGGSYFTSGNSNYSDDKGIEINLRKPLSGLWGGYLNYTWSTGIYGRSGDPDIIVPPGSEVQIGQPTNIGDVLFYDPARLKFGVTVMTPADISFLGGVFSNIQISMDYRVFYPNDRDPSHVFTIATESYLRPADVVADIRLRKEFSLGIIRPAVFFEVLNAFNNKWVDVNLVKAASPEDRVRFANSGFTRFPAQSTGGGPFPDLVAYRNLPRQIILGFALGF